VEEVMTEWVKINRHLQSVGTAACDVSHLILQADTLLEEEKNTRAAAMLMSAARAVLEERRKARAAMARALRMAHCRRPIGNLGQR
jgi:hypothetical protein